MSSGFLDHIFLRAKEWLLSPLAGAPDWLIQIVSSLINISAVLGVFLTLFALISVLERKILGRMQNRYGPNRVGPFGLFQPFADGIKMLIKEDIVPARADKVVHFLAPVILAAIAILTLGVIPYGRNMTPFTINGGLLFFVSGLVESNRTPFDVPEGESEIVAGHMTEYSGFKYATFFMAEYLGMFAISGLGVTLFLGGWHAPAGALEFLPSYVWFFAKLSALLFVYIWVRGTLPRTRIDQIMNLAWKFMLPMAFACVIAAAVWHYAGRGLRGWLWSLVVIAIVYTALSILLDTRRKFAPRVYRFAE